MSLDDAIHVLDSNSTCYTFAKQFLSGNNDFDLPFYTCNLADVVSKYELWTELLPRVKPYYAVKCNDQEPILRTLSLLGIGFDCASKSEIVKILDLGVDPSRIIFANPTKIPSHLRYATDKNVTFMTFDNESELVKIKSINPKARLLIRIRCDDVTALWTLGVKFGCEIDEVVPLLQKAKQLGLQVLGVAFHVGYGCKNPQTYSEAIKLSRKTFDDAKKCGFNFTILDIGGGFPGNGDEFRVEHAPVIKAALEQFFPEDTVDLISEPGNFFVHSSVTIFSCLHSLKKEANGHMKYYLNDGIYGSFRWGEEYVTFKPKILNERNGKNNKLMRPSSFWGPTCDGSDCIIREIEFPIMEVGNWISIDNMGDYWLQAHCSFNRFESARGFFIMSSEIAQKLDKIQRQTKNLLLRFSDQLKVTNH